jgi:integrase
MANRSVNLTKRDSDGNFLPVEFTSTGRIKQDATKGVYYLDWRQGSKRRRKSVGKDAAEALTQLKRLEAELNARAAGVAVEAPTNGTGKRALSVAIAEYLHEIEITKKPKTHAAYDVALRYFAESCAKLHVEDVERRDLLEYSAFLRDEKGQSRRSVRNKFGTVMSFLKWCGVRKLATKHDWPEYTEEEPEIYEREELDKLFGACTPEEKLWFTFFLQTGMREQEVMHATWADVNTTRKTVTVRENLEYGWTPKTYQGREIPIPDSLVDSLRALKKSRSDKDCALVFPTAGCKPKLDFLDCLKAAAERAKLKPETVWLHKFRATFATWSLWSGVDLRTVQLWLGHSDMESTMRYLKPSRDEQTRAKVNEIFAGY